MPKLTEKQKVALARNYGAFKLRSVMAGRGYLICGAYNLQLTEEEKDKLLQINTLCQELLTTWHDNTMHFIANTENK